jgi:hypothetical protein
LAGKWGSIVHFIGVGREVVETRAAQRRPKEERWNKYFVQNLLATPWCNPVPSADHRVPEVLPPREEPLSLPAPEGSDLRKGPTQVYILDIDFERYGYALPAK